MSKILKSLIAVSLFAVFSPINGKLYAQGNPTGIQKVDLRLIRSSINAAPTLDTGGHFHPSTFLNASLAIKLADTTNISAIQIKLVDTTSGSYTNFSKTFVFDQEGPFPDGTNYKREGLRLSLFLGPSFRGIKNHTTTVQLIPISGANYSPYINKK